MQDDTMVEEIAKPKGKGKGKAGKAGPAATGMETQVAKALVRAFWMENWSAANPDKGVSERLEAWKAVRQTATSEDLKKMRRIVMNMQRFGVTMTVPQKASKAGAATPEADSGSDA